MQLSYLYIKYFFIIQNYFLSITFCVTNMNTNLPSNDNADGIIPLIFIIEIKYHIFHNHLEPIY